MTTNTSRADRLDSTLAGLAMFEAYVSRDNDTLGHLTAAMPPGEAVEALLSSMEVMSGIFATQIGASTTQVLDSVRRRIVAELQRPS